MGVQGFKHSQATIERMKNDGRKGRKHTEEAKEKMSAWQKGLRHSPSSEFKKGAIPWNKGKKYKLSDNTRQEILAKRRSYSGPNNPNWRGGTTAKNIIVRNSRESKEWRAAIFERDDYTCKQCQARNGNGVNVYLEADHIKPFAYYPELRFELSNGRTLCKECHKKTPTYKVKRKDKDD